MWIFTPAIIKSRSKRKTENFLQNLFEAFKFRKIFSFARARAVAAVISFQQRITSSAIIWGHVASTENLQSLSTLSLSRWGSVIGQGSARIVFGLFFRDTIFCTVQSLFFHFNVLKKWANPGLFLYIFVLFLLQFQYKLKKA